MAIDYMDVSNVRTFELADACMKCLTKQLGEGCTKTLKSVFYSKLYPFFLDTVWTPST